MESKAQVTTLCARTTSDGSVVVPPWKIFGSGTQAGRLLARLYGVNPVHRNSLVTYPKRAANKSATDAAAVLLLEQQQPRPQWRAVNAKASNADPKKVHFDKDKVTKLLVPKVGRNTTNAIISKTFGNADVESIPKRKPKGACRKDVDKSKILKAAYRPPRNNAYSTEKEKGRLNEIFAHKGGSALPKELTHPISELPSDIQWRAKENKRIQMVLAKRRAAGAALYEQAINGVVSLESTQDQDSDLFNDLVREVKDRREFQISLEETGLERETLLTISAEISSRIRELKKIDPRRTRQFIMELYGEA